MDELMEVMTCPKCGKEMGVRRKGNAIWVEDFVPDRPGFTRLPLPGPGYWYRHKCKNCGTSETYEGE